MWRKCMMIARYAFFVSFMHILMCAPVLGQRHLEPEEGIHGQSAWQWNYARRLREALLPGAARPYSASPYVARMLCLPSFESEWVVTVVREDRPNLDAPHTYYVESLSANHRLFFAKGPSDLTVRRAQAPLDRETAESLARLWRRMLRRTRYPKRQRLGADGVEYHFSRSLPLVDGGLPDPLAGFEQGKIWSPRTKSLTGELVAIGEQLNAYAQAAPADREKILSSIRDKTARLTARLNKAR
jgi:hypothetical protein